MWFLEHSRADFWRFNMEELVLFVQKPYTNWCKSACSTKD